MTKRQPLQGYVAAYGAPSPVGEWWQPQDPGRFGPTNTSSPINFDVTEAEPRRLRVAVRLDEDGRLHVLVSEDGVALAESSTDGDSLAVEFDL